MILLIQCIYFECKYIYKYRQKYLKIINTQIINTIRCNNIYINSIYVFMHLLYTYI